MIVAGLIASVVDGGFKWFFFAFAILTFLPVIHYICWLRSKVVDARFDYSLFFWNYSTMANLTAFAWFAYPIVWVLSAPLPSARALPSSPQTARPSSTPC